MSDSVRPHRQQPTRLPHPWDSPGKNTGVGCHFLFQCMKVKSERKSLSHVRLFMTPWSLPTRLLCPWDFPGKSTGVGCHCLLCLLRLQDLFSPIFSLLVGSIHLLLFCNQLVPITDAQIVGSALCKLHDLTNSMLLSKWTSLKTELQYDAASLPLGILLLSGHSVVSDSLQLHELEPLRFLCLWNFPGKNTGVGCHALLQGIFLTQGSNRYLLCWQADSLLLDAFPSPLLGIYLKEIKSLSRRDVCIPKFIEALFTIAKICGNNVSVDRWMSKGNMIYKYPPPSHPHTLEYYSTLENSAICDNMDEPYIKWNKPDTGRQILQDLIHMWKLKKLNS